MIVELSPTELELLEATRPVMPAPGHVRDILAGVIIAMAGLVADKVPGGRALLEQLTTERMGLTESERAIVAAVARELGCAQREALAHIINAAGMRLPGGDRSHN